jgi:hypothetical protein
MSLTVIPITQDGATSLISRGKLKLYHKAYPQFNDQDVYPPSNFHPLHQQWQSSPYCADFEDKWQPFSQATPSPQSDSDVQAQILKLMGEIS